MPRNPLRRSLFLILFFVPAAALAACWDDDPADPDHRIVDVVDISVDLDEENVQAILEESFSFESGVFLHPDLTDEPVEAVFPSTSEIIYGIAGDGGALYEIDFGTGGGSILHAGRESRTDPFPPDGVTDEVEPARMNVQATNVPIGGDPVTGQLSLTFGTVEADAVNAEISATAGAGDIVRILVNGVLVAEGMLQDDVFTGAGST